MSNRVILTRKLKPDVRPGTIILDMHGFHILNFIRSENEKNQPLEVHHKTDLSTGEITEFKKDSDYHVIGKSLTIEIKE